MNHQLMFASLGLFFVRAPARADRCYSTHEGYKECWNGCCGTSDSQSCCSSAALVVSLSVCGGLLAVMLTTFGVCWLCRCHEKLRLNPGTASRARGRRRGRNSHHRDSSAPRSRRTRVVHPVAPPDYTAATQETSGFQPGLVQPPPIPFTPPPPYSEVATAPLPPPPLSMPPPSHAGPSGVQGLATSHRPNIYPTPVEG